MYIEHALKAADQIFVTDNQRILAAKAVKKGHCVCGAKLKPGKTKCTSCSTLAAEAGAPQETPTKVQAPSDLARAKGVLPVGNWFSKQATPTTVSLPSDIIFDMGKPHNTVGQVMTPKPTEVVNSKAKPVTPGNEVVASSLALLLEASGLIDLTIYAGGPGSGRHKMGLSLQQRSAVVTLRRQGFKSSAVHSVDGTHGMIRQDDTGKTHVFNIDRHGSYTHAVTTNTEGTKFKLKGSGNSKALGSYAASPKHIGTNSGFENHKNSLDAGRRAAFHAHVASMPRSKKLGTSAFHQKAAASFTRAAKAYSSGNAALGDKHYGIGSQHSDNADYTAHNGV